MDPLNYGWRDKNGCYTPDWFLGPAIPDNLFQKLERGKGDVEDHESDQASVATVFDEDDSHIENGWSDDSESEIEM